MSDSTNSECAAWLPDAEYEGAFARLRCSECSNVFDVEDDVANGDDVQCDACSAHLSVVGPMTGRGRFITRLLGLGVGRRYKATGGGLETTWETWRTGRWHLKIVLWVSR